MTLRPALRLPLAAAAGAVAALGFEPWGLWPLTIAAVGALFWLLDRTPNRRAGFATGWAFGWGHFALGLTWIATAFTYQAKMPAWLGWVAVFGLAMFLAIYAGLAAALTRGLVRRPEARALMLAAAWMLAEWLRGHLLSGFAWNPLGAVWLGAGGVGLAAAWIGGLGLSGLAVLAGGAVWSCSPSPLRGGRLAPLRERGGGAHSDEENPHPGPRQGARLSPSPQGEGIAIAVLVFVVICGGAWASGYLTSATALSSGPPIHLIQPNIGQGEKYTPDADARHLATYLGLTRAALAKAPQAPPSLVVWSESSVIDPVEDAGVTDAALLARLASVLRPGDLLLFGGVALNRDALGEVIGVTNSLYVLDASARLHGRYDKAHLVPLGEYVPLRSVMELIGLARLTPGEIDFAPGPGPQTLALPGFPSVGAQICYEIIFPAEVIDEAHRPAWLVNISNDAWFGPTGPPQHLAQARLRAIEEGLPVARATPTGIGALIDAHGRVLGSLPLGTQGVISGRLPEPLPPTLFARFGHWTSFVFGLLLVGGALVIERRKRTLPDNT